MDQKALGGKYQPKENDDAVSQDVTIHSLVPTYYCHLLICPNIIRSSIRKSLPKKVVTESLYPRFVRAVIEQAVLQALEGRYANIRKTRRHPPSLPAL